MIKLNAFQQTQKNMKHLRKICVSVRNVRVQKTENVGCRVKITTNF